MLPVEVSALWLPLVMAGCLVAGVSLLAAVIWSHLREPGPSLLVSSEEDEAE
jgi:hypothetical protein